METIVIDETKRIKDKIQIYIKKGLYGEAVNTINELNSDLRENVMLWSKDDDNFVCGLVAGICDDVCKESGGYTCCGCLCCGLAIIGGCFGMNYVDSICDWIGEGATNLIEKICCNDFFC